MNNKFKPGDKVLYRGWVYDFGYIGQTGWAIIYEEGCRNMQDSKAVDINDLTRYTDEKQIENRSRYS